MDNDWVIKRIERARYARSLELIAFSKTVSALRAGHKYTKKVAKSIKTIADILKIPDNFRRTEIRRAANDNFLSATATCILQENTDEGWLKAGVKCIPNQPIISANTTHTKLADYISDILKNLNNTDYKGESKRLEKCEDKKDITEVYSDAAETSSTVIPKSRFEIVRVDSGVVRKAVVSSNGSGIIPESTSDKTLDTFAERKELIPLEVPTSSEACLRTVSRRRYGSESNSTITRDSSLENVLRSAQREHSGISSLEGTTASATSVNANVTERPAVAEHDSNVITETRSTVSAEAGANVDVTDEAISSEGKEEMTVSSRPVTAETDSNVASQSHLGIGQKICSGIVVVPRTRLQSISEFVSKPVTSAVSSSSESSISGGADKVREHHVNEHAYCSETALTGTGKLTERDSTASLPRVVSNCDGQSSAKLSCSPSQLDLVKDWPMINANGFCKQPKSPASGESSAVDKLLLLVAAADLVAELITDEEERNRQSAAEKKNSTIPADYSDDKNVVVVVAAAAAGSSSANDGNDDSRRKEKSGGQSSSGCSESGAVAKPDESDYLARRSAVRRTIRKRNMPDFVSMVSRKKRKSEDAGQRKRRQDESAAESSTTVKTERTVASSGSVKSANSARNSSRKLSKKSSRKLSKSSNRRAKKKPMPEPNIIDFDELMNESSRRSSLTGTRNVSEPPSPGSNTFAVKRTRRKALPEAYDTGQTTVGCDNSTSAVDVDFNIVIIDDDDSCIGNESATVVMKPESPSILITSESSSSSLMSPEHSFNLIPTSRRQANATGKGKRCSDIKEK